MVLILGLAIPFEHASTIASGLVPPVGTVPGMWDTKDTSHAQSVVWPENWVGARSLRAQWFKILAESPAAWQASRFANHAKGEPPENTYFLWRGDPGIPEGTKLLLEGDFPHARFFSFQVGAPWSTELPALGDGTGIPEVALLDEDIEPDPGHINPFRPGADRDARNRHYHVTFELRDGNPVALNPQAAAPPYRAPGNLRIGGTRHGKAGEHGPYLWIRVFLPDRYEPFAGVEPPVLRIQYPSREPVLAPPCRRIGINNRRFLPPFAIDENPALPDGNSAKEVEARTALRNYARGSVDRAGAPRFSAGTAKLMVNQDGTLWLNKCFGTALYMASLKRISEGKTDELHNFLPRYYRQLYGMGKDAPPPGNDEHLSEHNIFCTYLLGAATLPTGGFICFRGKAPRTPRTLMGQAVMEPSHELRYMSITLQTGDPLKVVPVISVCDEDLVTDADGHYIVLIGAEADRPVWARAEAGVTWRAWPVGATLAINIRVVSTTAPPWEFAPQRITWDEGDLCQTTYQRDHIKRRMGAYTPEGKALDLAEAVRLRDSLKPPFRVPQLPEGAVATPSAQSRPAIPDSSRPSAPAAKQPPLSSQAVATAAKPTAPVRTASGPIIGQTHDGVRSFKGIPFAAPPLAQLRWKPPQPVSAWTEPRLCTKPGAACPQKGKDLYGPVGPTSEDCLYLNVWTPTNDGDAARLPVMFWIHGGGFMFGSGGKPCYDGEELARRGNVVVVTINYRLGPFGFLAHPALTAESPTHASGNYGIMDQIAALQWVRQNIATFGGDPACVTIFGQSAGGVSVCALMASPRAAGLFHRALVHSGSAPGNLLDLHTMEAAGAEFASRLGTDDLNAMRAKSADEVLAAAARNSGRVGEGTAQHLCIDGDILPESLQRTFASGRHHHVPLIAGTTQDEDPLFLAGVQAVLRSSAASQPNTFTYVFRRVPAYAAANGLGCFHGVELPYVFRFFPPALGFDADDARLSDLTIALWTQFARTGDPNRPGLPTWLPFAPSEPRVLSLDTETAPQ